MSADLKELLSHLCTGRGLFYIDVTHWPEERGKFAQPKYRHTRWRLLEVRSPQPHQAAPLPPASRASRHCKRSEQTQISRTSCNKKKSSSEEPHNLSSELSLNTGCPSLCLCFQCWRGTTVSPSHAPPATASALAGPVSIPSHLTLKTPIQKMNADTKGRSSALICYFITLTHSYNNTNNITTKNKYQEKYLSVKKKEKKNHIHNTVL